MNDPAATAAAAPGLEPAFDATLLSRIEDAGINASAPPQQRLLDGWMLRFSPGKAKRARCIIPYADGRLPLDARLAAAARAYTEAALPLIVRITPFCRPRELDAWLERQGMTRFDDTRVMVLENYAPAALGARTPGTRIEVDTVGVEAFAQRVGAWRGSSLAMRQAHAERLRTSPVRFHAFEAHAEGAVVACGQFALEDDLVGLYDIYTAPAARGRGVAGALCAALLANAHARGARHAYLQCEADNAPARKVYERLGFADAYAYHYRSPDPALA